MAFRSENHPLKAARLQAITTSQAIIITMIIRITITIMRIITMIMPMITDIPITMIIIMALRPSWKWKGTSCSTMT